MLLTTQQAKHWCRYLGTLHTAIDSVMQKAMMPISYECTRVSDSITGCGTCYQCTKQLILRALHTSTVPPADVVHYAAAIADSVFQYVTTLDERLNAPDGLGDDYLSMPSEQFAKVMMWAADQPDAPQPQTPRSPLAQWPQQVVWSLEKLDAWGRPRCQKIIQYCDDAEHSVQCALVAGHLTDCDTLPDWPPAPQMPWPLEGESTAEYFWSPPPGVLVNGEV